MDVTLNPLDCNLDFVLRDGNTLGSTLTDGGFAYMWSGARATVGITNGKYYFKVRILSPLPVTTLNTSDLSTANLARIGVSYLHTDVGKLGEVPLSWGYGGTGKKVSAGNFQDYGQPFGPGDEITCLVDLTAEPGLLSFAKNGMPLGIAFHIPRPYQPSTALFPHVLVKNLSVRVDFAGVQPPNIPRAVSWQPIINGHHPWRLASNTPSMIVVAQHRPLPFSQCEVLMLVGLPGVGKTTWAEQHAAQHPDKRYLVLGTNLVMEQMRVPGIARRQSYSARFEELMSLASEVFTALLNRAADVPRNYIIDQTNVYEVARKRKVQSFKQQGFMRRAVVFVLPDQMLFQRQRKQYQEEGKMVPDETIAEMKANFTIPALGQDFVGVVFAEAQPPEAELIVSEQRNSGRQWLALNKKRAAPGEEAAPGSQRPRMDLPPHLAGPGAGLMPQGAGQMVAAPPAPPGVRPGGAAQGGPMMAGLHAMMGGAVGMGGTPPGGPGAMRGRSGPAPPEQLPARDGGGGGAPAPHRAPALGPGMYPAGPPAADLSAAGGPISNPPGFSKLDRAGGAPQMHAGMGMGRQTGFSASAGSGRERGDMAAAEAHKAHASPRGPQERRPYDRGGAAEEQGARGGRGGLRGGPGGGRGYPEPGRGPGGGRGSGSGTAAAQQPAAPPKPEPNRVAAGGGGPMDYKGYAARELGGGGMGNGQQQQRPAGAFPNGTEVARQAAFGAPQAVQQPGAEQAGQQHSGRLGSGAPQQHGGGQYISQGPSGPAVHALQQFPQGRTIPGLPAGRTDASGPSLQAAGPARGGMVAAPSSQQQQYYGGARTAVAMPQPPYLQATQQAQAGYGQLPAAPPLPPTGTAAAGGPGSQQGLAPGAATTVYAAQPPQRPAPPAHPTAGAMYPAATASGAGQADGRLVAQAGPGAAYMAGLGPAPAAMQSNAAHAYTTAYNQGSGNHLSSGAVPHPAPGQQQQQEPLQPFAAPGSAGLQAGEPSPAAGAAGAAQQQQQQQQQQHSYFQVQPSAVEGGALGPYATQQQQQQQQHNASMAALVAGQAAADTQSTQQPLQQPQQQLGQGQQALQQSGAVQQPQAAAAAAAVAGAVGTQAPISSASDVGQMLAAAAAQGWTWDASRNDWIYSQPQVGAQEAQHTIALAAQYGQPQVAGQSQANQAQAQQQQQQQQQVPTYPPSVYASAAAAAAPSQLTYAAQTGYHAATPYSQVGGAATTPVSLPQAGYSYADTSSQPRPGLTPTTAQPAYVAPSVTPQQPPQQFGAMPQYAAYTGYQTAGAASNIPADSSTAAPPSSAAAVSYQFHYSSPATKVEASAPPTSSAPPAATATPATAATAKSQAASTNPTNTTNTTATGQGQPQPLSQPVASAAIPAQPATSAAQLYSTGYSTAATAAYAQHAQHVHPVGSQAQPYAQVQQAYPSYYPQQHPGAASQPPSAGAAYATVAPAGYTPAAANPYAAAAQFAPHTQPTGFAAAVEHTQAHAAAYTHPMSTSSYPQQLPAAAALDPTAQQQQQQQQQQYYAQYYQQQGYPYNYGQPQQQQQQHHHHHHQGATPGQPQAPSMPSQAFSGGLSAAAWSVQGAPAQPTTAQPPFQGYAAAPAQSAQGAYEAQGAAYYQDASSAALYPQQPAASSAAYGAAQVPNGSTLYGVAPPVLHPSDVAVAAPVPQPFASQNPYGVIGAQRK